MRVKVEEVEVGGGLLALEAGASGGGGGPVNRARRRGDGVAGASNLSA